MLSINPPLYTFRVALVSTRLPSAMATVIRFVRATTSSQAIAKARHDEHPITGIHTVSASLVARSRHEPTCVPCRVERCQRIGMPRD